jgi:hypothetical protein
VLIKGQVPASASVPNWRELYAGALLEKDRERLPLRIKEAETAIFLRERELFTTGGDTSEEAEAVDHALYALRALRSCLQLKTHEPEAA